MQIKVRGKNMEVTPALDEYINKRLKKLNKFFAPDTEVQAVLSVARDNHVVEVTVLFDSLILRGEESTGDMYLSIDMVVDKLEKQVGKYKTRINRRLRQKGIRLVNDRLSPAEDESDELKIVKTKKFILKPMPVEEAILQMNLLGHDFFVFVNADEEHINVLYRRKDGNYGLIDPDF